MNDLISIIIPVYNVEQYIRRCVDSILNQTYKNIEVILVDDGSTDNSGVICDEYAGKDNRVNVIHKKNGGLSDARNTGILSATGTYVMVVDSDDYISDKMVEVLYNNMAENNSDMSLCSFTYVDENGTPLELKDRKSPIKNEVLTTHDALKRLSGYSCGWYFVVAWNKLYKKELFDEIKFPFGKCHEDEFVVHRIFEKCRTISCVEEPLYFYVQRTGSIMNDTYSIKRLDVVEAYVDRALLFIQKDMYQYASQMFSTAISTLVAGYSRLDLTLSENRLRCTTLRKYIIDIYKKNKNVLLSRAGFKYKIKIISFILSVRLYKIIDFINVHICAGFRS